MNTSFICNILNSQRILIKFTLKLFLCKFLSFQTHLLQDLRFTLMFRVYQAFLSVHCSLVVTCWERANLLALVYMMFSCGVVTFSCVVLDQVWHLIASIPDLCLLTYFEC